MGSVIGVGQDHEPRDAGAREALHSRARLHLDVLKAVASNKAQRDAKDAHLFARNLAEVKDLLAKLEERVDASGMPPAKPWWSELWSQLKSAVLMAGR